MTFKKRGKFLLRWHQPLLEVLSFFILLSCFVVNNGYRQHGHGNGHGHGHVSVLVSGFSIQVSTVSATHTRTRIAHRESSIHALPSLIFSSSSTSTSTSTSTLAITSPLSTSKSTTTSLAGSSAEEQSSEEQSKSISSSTPAYILIEAKITDLEKFYDYASIVPSIVKRYGGEYIVLRGKHTPLEGDWGYHDMNKNNDNNNENENGEDLVKENEDVKKKEDDEEKLLASMLKSMLPSEESIESKIVLQKWPNEKMAKAFWNSPEYAEVKKLREGTGTFRIMLIEGLTTNNEE
jgi:uncharacterized protein (DUF1330 family)